MTTGNGGQDIDVLLSEVGPRDGLQNKTSDGATSAKRMPSLPRVPTISETGLPGYEVTNW